MEGYVAFLPVAFVLLLLSVFVGKGHIFPWTHEASARAREGDVLQRRLPHDARHHRRSALITLLSLWYIYTSVRLDVGRVAGVGREVGGGTARAHARRLRRRAPRDALDALAAGQARRLPRRCCSAIGWSVLALDLSMGLSLHFQSTLYGWWFFMGGWLCSLMLFSLLVMAWRRVPRRARRSDRREPLPRSRKALLRVHRVLGLPHVRPVPRDLVRQPGRGDALAASPPDRAVGGLTVDGGDAACSSCRSSACSRARRRCIRPTIALFALVSLVGMWLMRYSRSIRRCTARSHRAAVRPLGDRHARCGFLGAVGLRATSRS